MKLMNQTSKFNIKIRKIWSPAAGSFMGHFKIVNQLKYEKWYYFKKYTPSYQISSYGQVIKYIILCHFTISLITIFTKHF